MVLLIVLPGSLYPTEGRYTCRADSSSVGDKCFARIACCVNRTGFFRWYSCMVHRLDFPPCGRCIASEVRAKANLSLYAEEKVDSKKGFYDKSC